MPEWDADHRLSDDDLDALLRDASRRTPVPADLAPRIRRRVEAGPRQWRIGVAALATAATLLAAASLWVLRRPAPPASAPHGSVAERGPEPASPIDTPRRDVVVTPGPGLLARRVESSDPRVSIVLLYREIAPHDAPEPEELERNES